MHYFSMSVIFFLWLLAMALGIAYKRFIVGAKGWEQIPLLDWYKAFGNLEAVSFYLVTLMQCLTLHLLIRMVVTWYAGHAPAS